MEILAIIPARSGSKRVLNKNTRDFHNKPLLGWAIDAAKKSTHISRVVVSTDDIEIAKVAKKYGAEIPTLRPKKLAANTSAIEPVLIHMIEYLKEQENYTPDAIVLLMPPNPLRRAQDIDNAIRLFKKTKSDSVITVSEVLGNSNPHWILKKNPKGDVVFFNDSSLKEIITRSQDLPVCYSRNDIAYVLKPSNLYQSPSNLYGDHIELHVMDQFFDGDINTVEDWHIAYDKFRRQNN